MAEIPRLEKPLIGVDVSTWNKGPIVDENGLEQVDWEKVGKQIDFAIVRLGYGTGYNGSKLRPDKRAPYNIKMLNKLQIPYGGYWFSYAYTVEMARNEAKAAIEVANALGADFSYPVYFDFEGDSYDKGAKLHGVALTPELLRGMTAAFCDELRNAGIHSGVYTGISDLRQYYKYDSDADNDFTFCDKYDLWFAQWWAGYYGDVGKVTTPPTSYPNIKQLKMWQYTDCHLLDGISGSAGNDMNLCFVDYPSIIGKINLRSVALKDIAPTEATFEVETSASHASYRWYYVLKSLDSSVKQNKVRFSVSNAKASVKIRGLNPNSAYQLSIQAKNNTRTVDFPALFFTTKQAYPLPAKYVQFNADKEELQFVIPDFSSQQAGRSAGYKISALVNGQEIACTEELILKTNFNKVLTCSVKKLISNTKLNPSDQLQFSVLTYIIDNQNYKIFPELGATYSKPFCIEVPLLAIDKIFIRIKNIYYTVIAHLTKNL